jgi:hypothetical protein
MQSKKQYYRLPLYLCTHVGIAEANNQENVSPIFEDIYTFCEDVKAWLDEHPENIAVIHCKAGKVIELSIPLTNHTL